MNENISREEAANIALAAAKEAVRQSNSELFAIMGVNPADMKSLGGLRDDMIWVRRKREFDTTIGKIALSTFVGVVIVGVLTAIATAVWTWFRAIVH